MRRVRSFPARFWWCFRSARVGVALAWLTMLVAACARGGMITTSGGEAGGADQRPGAELDASGPSSICRRYLGCVATEDHAGPRFAELVLAYGAGARCWSGDASVATDCSEACREGALALPRCGECDGDDGCDHGLACIDRRCAPPGCRVDRRRADALIETACACNDDCDREAAFVHLLARASADADCAAAFSAWAACESHELRCVDGHVDLYAVCEAELAGLTRCENRGVSLHCQVKDLTRRSGADLEARQNRP
jgi:hypothetical protein